MKILIKCINAGVNNSQFIGERAYSELFYQTNRGGYFGGRQYGEESIIESGRRFYSEFFSQEAGLNIILLCYTQHTAHAQQVAT